MIKNSSQTQDTHAENLPETGDQSAQSILIGAGLFILGGSLYFFKGH
ncbi:LPXTG cell wall anchor domain-containing protein [Lactococcus sp. NH2-7C]|nr:LPXTG cell wall anchor domain-containing protein [Lactococcus sp. NH2-7C]